MYCLPDTMYFTCTVLHILLPIQSNVRVWPTLLPKVLKSNITTMGQRGRRFQSLQGCQVVNDTFHSSESHHLVSCVLSNGPSLLPQTALIVALGLLMQRALYSCSNKSNHCHGNLLMISSFSSFPVLCWPPAGCQKSAFSSEIAKCSLVK